MRRVEHEEIGLQIAPMIDLTLLLLFFFMLAGKITKGEKLLDIKVPTATSGKIPADEGDRDLINIDEKGQLYSGSRPVTTKELTAHLKERFKVTPAQTLCPRRRRNPGKKIKEVMAIASEAGAVDVIFGVVQK